MEKKTPLKLIKNDKWLEPFAPAIEGRYYSVLAKKSELTNGGKKSLSDFATGYLYFGLHRTAKGWVFREWAPNATSICLIGDFILPTLSIIFSFPTTTSPFSSPAHKTISFVVTG